MRKFLLVFSLALCLNLSAENRSGINARPNVIPALREWQGDFGTFQFREKGKVILDPLCEKEFMESAGVFAGDLRELGGWNYSVAAGKPEKNMIYITLSSNDAGLGGEGYRLVIGDRIIIEARTVQGAFWGTRTVLQMLQQQGTSLLKGTARDYPKYARRGFTFDVARKYIRLDFLQAYVKILSYYKMNEFHVHLNDNGFVQYFDNDWDKTYAAFRLESETFPGLTARDGHYKKKEFTALQRQGMVYGVNVFPEIDVPAHSLAFSHFRSSLGSKKYGMDHLDLENPAVYPFLDSLFREYLEGPEPVFVGPDVHIGTDEYSKDMAEEFRSFTDHYLRYVQGFGKRARLWGALTHAPGETPVTSKGVVMNAWYNGYADPKAMIEQGYELVSTPDGILYIVPAAGYYHDYLNLKYIYEKWEPVVVGNQVFPEGTPQISGGSFAVWNDHCGNGITEKDIHHRAFPALQVLAEKMWMGGMDKTDFERFQNIASTMIEAPAINIMGKIASKSDLVLDYHIGNRKIKDLSGNGYDIVGNEQVGISGADGLLFDGKSRIELPVPEIGYDYTVSFDICPASGNPQDAVLFYSPHATIVLNEKNTGNLAFKREGYCFHFDYVPQSGVWANLTIQGDGKGTALYVDGKLIQHLQGKEKVVKDKKNKESRMYIQRTLVFPLQYIGDVENGFKGCIRNLKVYNRKLL